jgi:hypothetical protein
MTDRRWNVAAHEIATERRASVVLFFAPSPSPSAMGPRPEDLVEIDDDVAAPQPQKRRTRKLVANSLRATSRAPLTNSIRAHVGTAQTIGAERVTAL